MWNQSYNQRKPMSTINLRVHFPEAGVTKMLQFDTSTTVDEIIQYIVSRAPETLSKNTPIENYGLYRVDPDDENIGHWMNRENKLNHYCLNQGDSIEFKDTSRLLKYKLPDGSMKTIMIDETKDVAEIFNTITVRAGIVNNDEYSLAVEEVEDFVPPPKKDVPQSGTLKKNDTGVSTMMKRLDEKEKKRLDKLKAKLQTDDEVRWVDHDKALCEQGITANYILSLRRKFFLESNKNVVDPYEINLLYNQCREKVLSGAIPCNSNEIAKLAALQLQAEKGDFSEAAYKAIIDWKDYIPRDCSKSRLLDKKIKEEYKNSIGLSPVAAKQSYSTFCQELKTYGISIWLVKEKMPGKMKLASILLGITKESVIRMDEKTKDILHSWPLTYVRRWAFTQNSFTFDFGDYDDNYSVLTSEAEQIASLISGYIDLIIKKKRVQANVSENTGLALVEESITPGQGVVMASGAGEKRSNASKAVAARGQVTERLVAPKAKKVESARAAGSRLYGTGAGQKVYHPGVSKNMLSSQKACIMKLSEIQNNLTKNISDTLNSTEALKPELLVSQNGQFVYETIASSNLATLAHSLNQLYYNSQNKDKLDYATISCHMVQSKESFLQLVMALKSLSNDENMDDIMNLIKTLSGEFKNIFDSYKISNDQIEEINKQRLTDSYNNTNKGLEKISKLINADTLSQAAKDRLNLLKQNLETAGAKVLKQTEKIESKCKSEDLKDEIQYTSRGVSKEVSKLVLSLTSLMPVLYDKRNKDLLLTMAENISNQLDTHCQTCAKNGEDANLKKLETASANTKEILKDISQCIADIDKYSSNDNISTLLDSLLNNMSYLSNADRDPEELGLKSKELAVNLGKLLAGLKDDYNNITDEQLKDEFFSSLRSLADSTKALIENTKALSSQKLNVPEFLESNKAIFKDISFIINQSYGKELHDIRIATLKKCLRTMVSQAINMDSAMKNAAETCRSEQLGKLLFDASEDLLTTNSDIINCLGDLKKEPDSFYLQNELIEKSKIFLKNSKNSCEHSKNAIPLVTSIDFSNILTNDLKLFAESIQELESILSTATPLSNEEILDISKKRLLDAQKYLQSTLIQFNNDTIQKYPAENKEHFYKQFMAVYRDILRYHAQLSDGSVDNKTVLYGILDKISQSTFKVLVPLYGLAACSTTTPEDRESCKSIFNGIDSILKSSIECVDRSNNVSDEFSAVPFELLEALKLNSDTLLNLISSLPANKEMENSAQSLTQVFDAYESKKPSPPLRPNQTVLTLQQDLTEIIPKLLTDIADLSKTVARDDNARVPSCFAKISEEFGALYECTNSLINNHKDKELSQSIHGKFGECVGACGRLLSSCKVYTSEPNNASKTLVSDSTKQLSEALSSLLVTISSAKPGVKECESCKNTVKLTYATMLENCNTPVLNNKTYEDCLNEIEKILTQSYPIIFNNFEKSTANENALSDVSKSIEFFEKTATSILKNTTQATYILGMTDALSKSGKDLNFDISSINASYDAIKADFAQLLSSSGSLKQSEIDSATRDISQNVFKLMSLFKEGANNLSGIPEAFKSITEKSNSLGDVSKMTISSLKSLDPTKDEDDFKRQVTTNKNTLCKEIDGLIQLLDLPAIHSISSKIGDTGLELQRPVIDAGLEYIESIVHAIESLGGIISKYDESKKPAFQETLQSNRSSVENLVLTLQENSPGEGLLTDIIDRLTRNAEEIELHSTDLRSSTTSSSSSKEHEKRFENSMKQFIEIVIQIKDTPSTASLTKPRKLEIPCDIIEGYPELLRTLIATTPNVDDNDISSIFEKLGTLNSSLIDCAKSLRFKTNKNETPLDPKRTIQKVLEVAGQLSSNVISALQKANMIHQIIAKLDNVSKSLKANDLTALGTLPAKEGEKKIIERIKAMLKTSQDLSVKCANNPSIVEPKCKELLSEYQNCGAQIFGKSSPFSGDISQSIQHKYLDIGNSLSGLMLSITKVTSTGASPESKRELTNQSKGVSTQIAEILKLIQSAHKGAVACAKISDQLHDSINEIDTSILFAQNDSLDKEESSNTISQLKPEIMKSSQEITDALTYLKKLKSCTDENILEFSNRINQPLLEFFTKSKSAAVSFNSTESDLQLAILDATKNVAGSFGDLFDIIQESQHNPSEFAASKNNVIDSTIRRLGDHNKTITDIEAKFSQASDVLENVLKHLDKIGKFLNKDSPCEWDSDALKIIPVEEMVKISKDIPLSCAKIVQSINKPKEMEASITKVDNVFENLTRSIRKYVVSSSSPAVGPVAESAKKCIQCFEELVKVVKGPNVEKSVVNGKSRNVTEAVVEFVKKCSQLKSETFGEEDPNVLAEQELLNAAAAIEMAAKKLSELKPRVSAKTTPNQDLNFEGQILEAANSIMKATALLVAAATSAQKEISAQDLKQKKPADGGQWSQGLISAARLVSESVNLLCDAAKEAVEGRASEEKLIAACQSISGSTAQLIMACKVKAGLHSEIQTRLEKAGFAVKNASKNLVNSLKGSGVFKEKEEADAVELSSSKVTNMKVELDAMEEILKREKELKEAREKLFKLRQAKSAPKKD